MRETALVYEGCERDRGKNDSEYELAAATLCEFALELGPLGIRVIHVDPQRSA